MKNYKDIENTRYIISRVFANGTTTKSLIERRILEEKGKLPPLTGGGNIIYNIKGGSIRSEEVL